MKRHYLYPLLALFTIGCASSVPNKDEIKSVDSGHYFLKSQLDDDMVGMSWIMKDCISYHFSQVKFNSVDVKSSGVDKRVSKEVKAQFKEQVLIKIDERLKYKLPSYSNVTLENEVLDISVMLYGIEDIPEDIRITEFTPVGAIIGVIKYVAGTRDRSIHMLASVDLKDHDSSKLIGRRIFVLNDNGVLENEKSDITIEMLDKNIEQITQQVVNFAIELLPN